MRKISQKEIIKQYNRYLVEQQKYVDIINRKSKYGFKEQALGIGAFSIRLKQERLYKAENNLKYDITKAIARDVNLVSQKNVDAFVRGGGFTANGIDLLKQYNLYDEYKDVDFSKINKTEARVILNDMVEDIYRAGTSQGKDSSTMKFEIAQNIYGS